MQPYYSHAGITIYHGDCCEVVHSLTPDAIVTDPPYGIALENHGMVGSNGWSRVAGDFESMAVEHILAWAYSRTLPTVVFAL